jgi:hypothetical protein
MRTRCGFESFAGDPCYHQKFILRANPPDFFVHQRAICVAEFWRQEQADAAPIYFVLRNFIQQLKQAREAAGLTLGEVSARAGMALESLSRLETGALTNPTWKTLGLDAAAVGRRPQLTAEIINRDHENQE